MNDHKPPYVRFEYRPVEDREATNKEGRVIYKDVAFALVMSPGSRDEVEKIADEWLTSMLKQSQMHDREYLREWHSHFTRCYDEWKKGNEIPEIGTPIKMCLMFKPSEIASIIAGNVRTLEDLASANEDAIGRIGIGARELQDRARQWIKTSKNVGASSEEIVTLKKQIETLEDQAKAQAERIEKLLARLESTSDPKRKAA